MVRHLVMWKLQEQAEGKTKAENAVIIKKSLEDLAGKVPDLLSILVGINLADAPASNYDIVLNCTFPNMEALNAYQVHPLHKAAAGYIKKTVEARVCVDYEE